MPKIIDLTGQKFGKLYVLERAETKNKRTYWKCLCDCGNEKCVEASNLKSGHTTSCGCLWRETIALTNKEINTRHGESHTKLHKTWVNMRYRCYNPRSKAYKHYGGRGITICEEWDDYEVFREWALANGFKNGLSIDRIDVNGNYEPSNCRWADDKTQANNKRSNNYLTYNGITHTIKEWSEITGIKWTTIKERLKRGWTVERTLTEK